MAAEHEEPTQEPGTAAETEERDYKALYEEWRGHARKWEERAKANSAAKAELDQIKDAQKTDAERMADLKAELDAASAERDALRAQAERRGWDQQVAEATGLPLSVVSIISADSLDSLQERARTVADGTAKRRPLSPDPGEGRTPQHVDAPATGAQWLRSSFENR